MEELLRGLCVLRETKSLSLQIGKDEVKIDLPDLFENSKCICICKNTELIIRHQFMFNKHRLSAIILSENLSTTLT